MGENHLQPSCLLLFNFLIKFPWYQCFPQTTWCTSSNWNSDSDSFLKKKKDVELPIDFFKNLFSFIAEIAWLTTLINYLHLLQVMLSEDI